MLNNNLSQQQTPQEKQSLKKSSFITDLESQRRAKISYLTPSRKQMSSSSFFADQNPVNFQYPTQHLRLESQRYQDNDDQLRRARSLKSLPLQKIGGETTEKNTTNQLNQNIIRLRMEELSFKVKSKLGSILKQLGLSQADLSVFERLARIEDMILFLSEKIREKVLYYQINEANAKKIRVKEKQAMHQLEAENQALRKKIQDKQNSETLLKNKAKESHIELRQVYDKLNLKEKELSAKITELYQAKVTLSQNQSLIHKLQHQCDFYSKQSNSYRNQLEDDNKEIIYSHKEISQENLSLRNKLESLEEQLKQTQEKERIRAEMNSQLNQELIRWRERFEDGLLKEEQKSKKSSESNIQNPSFQGLSAPINQLKKSTMSASPSTQLQGMQLSMKVQSLQKQNKQLLKDLQDYKTLKKRYQSILDWAKDNEIDFNQRLTLQRANIQQRKHQKEKESEIQSFYKKKMEEVANEWKNKLYELVQKYEDEIEEIKQSNVQPTNNNQQLNQITLKWQNQKRELEAKVLTLEKYIYDLLKEYKKVCALTRTEPIIKQNQLVKEFAENITEKDKKINFE